MATRDDVTIFVVKGVDDDDFVVNDGVPCFHQLGFEVTEIGRKAGGRNGRRILPAGFIVNGAIKNFWARPRSLTAPRTRRL
ncbi:hypothetical protein OKW41_009242 [Paraburkholderia sp. UCT70]|uniref:hypothetical protein n=1 Tax=Paraburkholderia sp. UCT70 TaxID=2991068 RepID=UPI003D1CB7C0